MNNSHRHDQPFLTLSTYLNERYGQTVYKVSLDGGFTCPNRDGVKGRGGCIYCNPSALKPRDALSEADIMGQLEDGMARLRTRYGAQRFIAYFQSNTSTYAPVEELERVYRAVAAHEDVVGLAVSTRPDCLGVPVLGLLERMKEEKGLWVELGLQSAKDETLRRMNRGHSAGDFSIAIEECRKRGIEVCAHVILGLPGETEEDMLGTMAFLRAHRVWGVKFHQLQVMRGTPLFQEYEKGRVRTLGLEEYTWLVIRCLGALHRDVVVHRLIAETPEALLVAPRWGVDKFMVLERIRRGMAEKLALAY